MPVVRLKGLNQVKKALKDGTTRVYWYAWKGGPKLEGAPGTPEFMASYNAALESIRRRPNENLAGLVQRYRSSPEYAKLAKSTKTEWSRWLDRVAADVGPDDIGGLTYKLLDDRRVRADIIDWRNQWKDRPRSADYAIQVLSVVLSHAIDAGILERNATKGISQLYASSRSDQVWEPGDVAAYIAKAPSPEVSFIVPLACLTGLRREDLISLLWSQVGDIAIVKPTSKSRGMRSQTVPILPETKALFERIRAQQAARHEELCALAVKKKRPPPPRCLTVLSNTRGQPWSVNGLEHQVIDTKAAAGVDKHLHDGRGTFATRLRRAGLNAPEIADIIGWEEKRVERLLATYVDRDAIVMALAARINRADT
jgi:integrase